MPTYVYECAKCGEELEAWQSFSDEPLKKHPGCGGKLTKVMQPVGIVFKGSGFHRTDSRSGGKRSSGAGSGDSKDSEKTAASTSDAKSGSSDSSSGNGSKKPSNSKESSGTKESSTSSTTTK